MKTIFIYNQGIEVPLKYFVLEGDYLHLHGTYINCTDDEEKVGELESILAYGEGGNIGVTLLDYFPVDMVTSETRVIEVGFMP